MTVEPAAWHELARQGARRTGAAGADLEDSIGAVLEAFTKRPPATPGEAVNRAELHAIDWLRSWHGDARTPSGRRKRDTRLEAANPIAYVRAGDVDVRLELLERLDELEQLGLSIAELEAIAAHVAGYACAELDRLRGRSTGAAAMALSRARRKIAALRFPDSNRKP